MSRFQPSRRAIALRMNRTLTAPTLLSLVPTLASPGVCEVSLERCFSLHLRPAELILPSATLTMIWKARACLRTSIFVHRLYGRTTIVRADLKATQHGIVDLPAQLRP